MTQHQKPARYGYKEQIAGGRRRGVGDVRAEAMALAQGRGCRPESVGQVLMEGLESGAITCDELDEIVETLRSLDPGLAHAVMGGGRFDRQLRARSLAQQIQADSQGGPAGRLPQAVLRAMEWALGADFGGVRVREGAEAEALGAEAFARDEEIVFAPGRFEPGTVRGRELIGHELVHVMQQRAGRVTGGRGSERGAGPVGDGVVRDRWLEAEADRLGGRAARGERSVVGWVYEGEASGGAAQLKAKEGAAGKEDDAGKDGDEKPLRRRLAYQVQVTAHGRPEVVGGKVKSRREMVISLETATSDKAGTFVADHTMTLFYDEGFSFAYVSVSDSDADGLMLPVVIAGRPDIESIVSRVDAMIAKVKKENTPDGDKPVVGPKQVATFVVQLEGAKAQLRELVESRGWPALSEDMEEAWYSAAGSKAKDLRPVVIMAGESDLDGASKGTPPSVPSLPPKPAVTPPAAEEDKKPEVPSGGEGDKDKPDEPPGGEGDKDKPETPKATVTETNIEVNQKILFATDDDNPAGKSRASLDQVAKALNEHPEIAELVVEGHTDSTGKPEHNQDLSQRRANQVRDHLRAVVRRDDLEMEATGLGQSQPVASNRTKDGKAQNRRVVFNIRKLATKTGGGEAAVQKRVASDGSKRVRDTGEQGRVAQHGLEGEGDPFPFVAQIQEAFGGYDLGSVRAHLDARAMEAARELRAEAYASGEDVAFAKAPDLHTAAHEAAHVVQQRAGVSLAGGVGQAGDRYEQHADQVADAVVSGRSAEPVLSQMAGEPDRMGAGSPSGRGVQRVEAKAPAKGEAEADAQASGTEERGGPLAKVDDVVGRLGEAALAGGADKKEEALAALGAVIGWLEVRSATGHIMQRFGASGLQAAQFAAGRLLGDLKAIRGMLRLGSKPKGLWTSVQRQMVMWRSLLLRLNDEPAQDGVVDQLASVDRGLGVVAGCIVVGSAIGVAAFIGAEVVTLIGANYLRAELAQLIVLNPEIVAGGVGLVLEISSVGLVKWASQFKTWEGALHAVKGMMEVSMMVKGGRGGPTRVQVKATVVEQTPKGLKVKIPVGALPKDGGDAAEAAKPSVATKAPDAGHEVEGKPATGGPKTKASSPEADVDGASPRSASRPKETKTKESSQEGGTRRPGAQAADADDQRVETERAMKASGQTEEAFKAVQGICDAFDVIIRFRPTSKHAKPHIEKGASPKPESVKMKTVNDTDVDLGARPSTRGTVGYGKLRLPKNFNRLEKTNPKKAAQIRERLRERRAERKALGKDQKELEKKGDFKFKKRQMIDTRPGAGRGKPVAGDNDLFDIRNADGSPITDKAHYDQVMGALKSSAANVQHPDVMSWKTKKPKDAKMKAGLIKRHQKGGEKLIEFRPGGNATQSFAEGDAK